LKLVEARSNKLLSIRELASKAGLQWRTVYNIEKGTAIPTLGTVRKLSEALEMDPREIEEFRAAIEKSIRGKELARVY